MIGHYLAYFFIIAGGLVLVYNFWFSGPRIMRVVQDHHATPFPVPYVGSNDVIAMGHGSCGSWVKCAMGHMGHKR